MPGAPSFALLRRVGSYTLVITMPTGLKRYQEARQFHFITFSCYHRKPLLLRPEAKEIFEQVLEQVRSRHTLAVAGYVLMPEHVHLLVDEPPVTPLATVLQVLKQTTSRRLKAAKEPQFWQTRYSTSMSPAMPNIWRSCDTSTGTPCAAVSQRSRRIIDGAAFAVTLSVSLVSLRLRRSRHRGDPPFAKARRMKHPQVFSEG